MTGTALSSVLITELRPGSLSLVQILSSVKLATAPAAVLAAWRGRIGRHRRIMMYLVLCAIVGAGVFTLLPGCIVPQVVFG